MTAKKTKTSRKYDTLASLRKDFEDYKAQNTPQASLQPQGEPQMYSATQDPIQQEEAIEQPYVEPEQGAPVVHASEPSSPKKILGMSVTLFNILLCVFVVIGLIAFIAFRYDNVKRDRSAEQQLEKTKDSIIQKGKEYVEEYDVLVTEQAELEAEAKEKKENGEKLSKKAQERAKELEVLIKYNQDKIKQNNEKIDSLGIGDLQSGVNEDF